MARSESNWIQTYTGRKFWPTDPREEDVHVEDIAHALSNLCRYTGHSRWFYPVAQHSVLVSRLVAPAHELAALLHDASEAYLADIARPVKRELPDYRAVEERLERVIADKFGFQYPLDDSVKAADIYMLAVERRDLMPGKGPAEWDVDCIAVDHAPIQRMSPEQAKAMFLQRYYEIHRVLTCR